MTTRRSSFFCRQLNSVMENSTSDNGTSTDLSEEDQIILDHVSKIEQTIEGWRSEYFLTKARYKELEKYKDNVNVIQYNQCRDILLPDDTKFLDERLDFTALIRQLETLIAKVEVMRPKMCKMNSKMTEKAEVLQNGIVDLKRRICKYLLECDESADLFPVV